MFSVSVIIPAYNSANHIKRSVESVLKQTVLPLEIIIVDDGSTDDTANIANSYGGIVRVVSKGRNCGLPAARNFGVENATGAWMAFLDSDDAWEPKKNEIAINLVKSQNSSWCMVAQQRVDSSKVKTVTGSLTGKFYFDNYFLLVLQGKGSCPSSIMVKKSVFENIGGFNEQLTTGEDLEMWWRIANEIPKISYFSQPLVKYYVDVPGSMTNSRRNEMKLIAFWDAVAQLSSTIEDSRNSELFIKVRDEFASKAIRYYLRDGYYKAADHLKSNKVIKYQPLMKSLLMLPNSFARIICILLYNSKNRYFRPFFENM